MASSESKTLPIQIFGAVLVVVSVLGVWFFYSPYSSGSMRLPRQVKDHWPDPLAVFVVGALAFHLFTGLGTLFLTRWGYPLFKIFLYLLFVAFPIGTIISYITLRYLRQNDLRPYFGIKASA